MCSDSGREGWLGEKSVGAHAAAVCPREGGCVCLGGGGTFEQNVLVGSLDFLGGGFARKRRGEGHRGVKG